MKPAAGAVCATGLHSCPVLLQQQLGRETYETVKKKPWRIFTHYSEILKPEGAVNYFSNLLLCRKKVTGFSWRVGPLHPLGHIYDPFFQYLPFSSFHLSHSPAFKKNPNSLVFKERQTCKRRQHYWKKQGDSHSEVQTEIAQEEDSVWVATVAVPSS